MNMAGKKSNPWIVALVGLLCIIAAVVAAIALALALDVSSGTADILEKVSVPIILLVLWAFRTLQKESAAKQSNKAPN
jgi:hypothetical protein